MKKLLITFFQLFVVSAVLIYCVSLLYVKIVFSQESETFEFKNKDVLKEVDSPFGNIMFIDKDSILSSINGRVISFSLNLPLNEEDYYAGKFTNAKTAVKAFNQKLNILYPGDEIKLVYGEFITLSPGEGYIMTEFGQGSGSCWTVTVLGGLIDEANTYWLQEYGSPLFIIKESHPHSEVIKSYANVNYGYGYNIFYEQDENQRWRDYVFQVNPDFSSEISTIIFEFKYSTNDGDAYNGEAISGQIWILSQSLNTPYISKGR